jgi:hypothetical protein
MTEQDKDRQQQHAMDEEADMSGGTGGNMGGDLNAGKQRERGQQQKAGHGAGGSPGRGSGSGQSEAD